MTRADIPTSIGPGLAIVLGSIVVHAQEFTEPGGHEFDLTVLRQLVNDEKVVEFLKQFGPGFLPVKRTSHGVRGPTPGSLAGMQEAGRQDVAAAQVHRDEVASRTGVPAEVMLPEGSATEAMVRECCRKFSWCALPAGHSGSHRKTVVKTAAPEAEAPDAVP